MPGTPAVYEFVHVRTGVPSRSRGELLQRRRRGTRRRRGSSPPSAPCGIGTQSSHRQRTGRLPTQVLHDRADRLLVAHPGGEAPPRVMRLVDHVLPSVLEVALALRARAHDRVQREGGRNDSVRTSVPLRDHRVVRDADSLFVVDLAADGVADAGSRRRASAGSECRRGAGSGARLRAARCSRRARVPFRWSRTAARHPSSMLPDWCDRSCDGVRRCHMVGGKRIRPPFRFR